MKLLFTNNESDRALIQKTTAQQTTTQLLKRAVIGGAIFMAIMMAISLIQRSAIHWPQVMTAGVFFGLVLFAIDIVERGFARKKLSVKQEEE